MTESVPASMIQQQFWLNSELVPDSSAYNIISWFDGTGSIDLNAAQNALDAVVGRHTVLRGTLQNAGGRIIQKFNDVSAFGITVEDCRESYKASADAVFTHMVQTARKPFHLSDEPLLRAYLFLLADEQFVFLIVMQHSIVDLHTKRLFASEFSLFYGAFLAGGPAPEMPAPVQYADYIGWQQNWLKSDVPQKMADIWKKELESQSGVLNLPTDFLRRSIPRQKGDVVTFRFDRGLFHKIEHRCDELRIDRFLFLLTAYLVLLYRHTNQSDITLGVPLTNRRHRDFKDVFGCFMNVLPLSFELTAGQTFLDTLKQVRYRMLIAHRNQELPIQRLLDVVQPKGTQGINPVYQTAFTVEPPMEMALKGVTLEPRKVHHGGAQLDMFMSFWDVTNDMAGYLEYDVDIFDRKSVERMVQRYQTLVAHAVESPEVTLADLTILDTSERNWLIHEVNQTQCAVPDVRLHELVTQQAKKWPDKVAFRCDHSVLTYRSLDERSNQLAHYLNARGVNRDSLVGVYLNRSVEMMVAILGILKCGAAYVPLDPKFPQNRLNYIIDVTRLPVLITESALAGKLEIQQATEFCIDTGAAALDSEPTASPNCAVSADDRAYVLFTSGSTGKPKGIAIHHEAVVNFLLSMAKEPGISSDDVLLAVTTLSFDISILELFLPIISGATAVIVKSEDAVNGEALCRLLEESKASILQGTPSTWQILLGAGLKLPGGLKVLCGGEALPPGLAQQLCEISDDVWNLYGPTETTIWSTCCKVEKNAPVRIGHPIDNTQIYIVDENLRLVPNGVSGELIIGGLGVSHGYLNRPDLNETKFLDDPFQSGFPNRIYRTGDLARYHHDGSLEHLGRTDGQIKLRGFRIELSEIESALSAFPGVTQCAVVLAEKSSSDKRLVAYVSHASPAPLSEGNMKTFLRTTLPEYMVPSFIEQLDALPLTANGKIDRKRLPAPAWSGGSREESLREQPENDAQRMLLSIWSSQIGTNDIGVKDNFFDVGGNSLMVMNIVGQIEKESGTKISVADFFQHPTIDALSKCLTGDSRSGEELASGAKLRAQKRAMAIKQRNRRQAPRRTPQQ